MINRLSKFVDEDQYSLHITPEAKEALSAYKSTNVSKFLIYQLSSSSKTLVLPISIKNEQALKVIYKDTLKSFYIDGFVFYMAKSNISKFPSLDICVGYKPDTKKYEVYPVYS